MVQIGRCKMVIYKVISKWFRTDVQRKPSSGGPAGQGIFVAIVLEHSSL